MLIPVPVCPSGEGRMGEQAMLDRCRGHRARTQTEACR